MAIYPNFNVIPHSTGLIDKSIVKNKQIHACDLQLYLTLKTASILNVKCECQMVSVVAMISSR